MDIQEQLETLYTFLVTNGLELALDVLSALVILIVGFWFAGRLSKLLKSRLNKLKRMDTTVAGFLAALVRYGLIIVTIVAVLEQFGVETTSLVAVLGAAGLAIGLALQGTLSNVAAGVMLLFFRPFKPGNFVDVGGIAGTVTDLTLFTTDLNTPDNVHITVPNSQIWGQAITNYSHNATRRIDIPCGIGYGEDINQAMKVMLDAMSDPRVLENPGPQVFVDALGGSSVDMIARFWCNASDYWQIKWDMTKAVKEALDEAGIEIPFPQQVVSFATPLQTNRDGEKGEESSSQV